MSSPQPESLKQGLAFYSQTPQSASKLSSFQLPPRADGTTMSRTGNGSRQALRMQDYSNT
jgi:hypothetical protein